MRSDKLGYNAPIEVYDNKYYRYSDPDYSIFDMPLSENDYEVMKEAVEMLKQLEDFDHFSEMADVKMEEEYFDADKAMFHYNHIYKKHNDRYITEKGLPLKRFLYYLRGILVCKWLSDKGTVPPVRFSELVDATIEDENIKKKIEHLLEQKKQSKEHNLEPVDEELFSWAEKWAEYYNQMRFRGIRMQPVGELVLLT